MSRERALALALLLVAAVIAWSAWKQGAYFPTISYPAAGAMGGLLACLLLLAPFEARIVGPALVALLALSALAVMMFASLAWTPVQASAVRDGMHAGSYVVFFCVGLWLAHLLKGRMHLALAPVAAAGIATGIATVFVLATGTDVGWYLHGDATLRLPIGYRNANAAYWMICFWPLVALIAAGRLRWWMRAVLAGGATMLVELMFLSQSRGSIPGVVISGLLFIGLSRDRLRAAAIIGIVVVPSLLALPSLLDVYQHGAANAAVVPLLRDSAKAIAATVLLSVVLSAVVFGGVSPRVRLTRRATSAIGMGLAAISLVMVLGFGAIFVARHGGPVRFVDERLEEFNRVGYPDLHGQGIRYGANVGSNRHDFWRVAAHEGLEHPLLGDGSGSFEVDYLERRRSEEAPEDPHSVEALMFSELGFPGLALLVSFVAGAAIAGLRSRRLGPMAAVLAAGGLAAGAQWLTQSSYDWLWNYPGVTAPAIFLLGAAAAPALLDPAGGLARRIRLGGIAVLAGVAVVSLPLFLSSRYLQRSYGEAADRPQEAISDLSHAADLNPFDADPLLIKATIESRLGETKEALSDAREALEREPRSYLGEYLIALELEKADPAAARLALSRAHELNPKDASVAALEERLDSAPSAEP